MNIKTLIVDDEAPARRRMKKLLQRDTRFDLVGEAESGHKAIELINRDRPDLMLLDIQLKDITGFEVLHSINTPIPDTVFITAFDQYAIQAFEENAIDYLLKPYKDERFYEAISRARQNIERTSLTSLAKNLHLDATLDKLQIPEGKTVHMMDTGSIVYIQANTYYCNFQLDDSSKMIRVSLKFLETLLPQNFVRINKSVIINKDKITSIRALKTFTEIEMAGNKTFSSNRKIL